MAVAATGFFDGVHLGHRQVLNTLLREAGSRGEESMVVTFWPHPRTVLQDDARRLRLLNSLSEKKDLLLASGLQRVEVLDFTKEFSRMDSERYLTMLRDSFGVSAVVLGYDNRIGSDLLLPEDSAAIARSLGMDAVIVPPVPVGEGDAAISSTKIRTALCEGLVDRAAAMLGYTYMLHGVVVAGNRLGRTIGFPTANMQLYEPLKQLPGNGVYCVDVQVLGSRFKGMCNIGVRPTVGGGAITIETNIFDFDEDIYGLDIRLSFLRKIRDEKLFGSLSELRSQLESDRSVCM
ncbi:MAG: riboflavin biosynthesis protein RibF [Bacteroidales bacterium]|nr:riboflavin biosynthesis protein RibF [Bacteroidales bacterium]